MSPVNKAGMQITRRDFIKGAAMGAAGVAAASALPGSALAAPEPVTKELPRRQQWDFEVPPPPIAAGDIKKTETTDVVVVGAGNAGWASSISAAEAGAEVILIQNMASFFRQAGYIGAVGSRIQKALNVRIDRDEVVAEICRWGGWRVDQQLITFWAEHSGEMIDWMTGIAKEAGVQLWLETDVKRDCGGGVGITSYPVCHHFSLPEGSPYDYHQVWLEKKALAVGVDIRYETPGVQLLRKGKGRVTGIVAKNKDGDYVQFNARKAVILCAGGYQSNPEMLQAYCPRAFVYSGQAMSPTGTGDGIKMGIWVGAAIDELPHAPMQFDSGLLKLDDVVGFPGKGGMGWRQPFLQTNVLGERFANEDLPYGYNCNAGAQQPEHVWWKVWDENWPEDLRRFHTTVCARIIPHPMAFNGMVNSRVMTDMEAEQDAAIELQATQMDIMVQTGQLQKADTIEELAEMMKVPVDTFKATVERYNELAKLGKDLDFGKVSYRLSSLEKPPFYAGKYSAGMLSTLNGLRINTKMQVIDTEFNVIPGLYAAGDNSGGFFAYDYPQLFGGLALGRTLTFGRHAGLNAAAEA